MMLILSYNVFCQYCFVSYVKAFFVRSRAITEHGFTTTPNSSVVKTRTNNMTKFSFLYANENSYMKINGDKMDIRNYFVGFSVIKVREANYWQNIIVLPNLKCFCFRIFLFSYLLVVIGLWTQVLIADLVLV